MLPRSKSIQIITPTTSYPLILMASSSQTLPNKAIPHGLVNPTSVSQIHNFANSHLFYLSKLFHRFVIHRNHTSYLTLRPFLLVHFKFLLETWSWWSMILLVPHYFIWYLCLLFGFWGIRLPLGWHKNWLTTMDLLKWYSPLSWWKKTLRNMFEFYKIKNKID